MAAETSFALQLAGGRRLDLSSPVIMGILNVTPDSFSDGGQFTEINTAIERAVDMAAAGAALIDVGGESTRPGAAEVSAQEEMDRVIPVVTALADRGLIVSVDTSKPEVMRAAASAGAAMINDVRALQTPGALEVMASTDLALCLMHMQGAPRTMQIAPHYEDVVQEVFSFLEARAQACLSAGIESSRIALDPGFGFGKSLAHNLALLAGLPDLVARGYAVLVGLSRKSMLAAITGRDVEDRLAGSITLATLSALAGAHIIRVHDVAATRDSLAVVSALRSAQSGPVEAVKAQQEAAK